MAVIRDPDLDWLRKQVSDEETKGLFGIWSADGLDGWVGKDAPPAQAGLGGEEGGRVRLLKGVPHAFSLRQEHFQLVSEIVAKWMAPSEVRAPSEGLPEENSSLLKSVVPM